MEDYGAFVSRLTKPGSLVADSLTPEKANLWHMATGVSTEAGELLDAAKKHVIYQRPLDRQNIIEELGDLEFYTEGVRQCLGVTRQEVLESNIAKLKVRFGGQEYTDAAARDRADKRATGPTA